MKANPIIKMREIKIMTLFLIWNKWIYKYIYFENKF